MKNLFSVRELITHVHRHFVWTVHKSLREIASHFGELETAMQTEAHMRNFNPNFALLNLYADGNHHMNYHQDNEIELDQHCVVSLSLGVSNFFAKLLIMFFFLKKKDIKIKQ